MSIISNLTELSNQVQEYNDHLASLHSALQRPVERLQPSCEQEHLRFQCTRMEQMKQAIEKSQQALHNNLKDSVLDNTQIIEQWLGILQSIEKAKTVFKAIETSKQTLAGTPGIQLPSMNFRERIWHRLSTPVRGTKRTYYQMKYAIQDFPSKVVSVARNEGLKIGMLALVIGALFQSNASLIAGTAILSSLAAPKVINASRQVFSYCLRN